MGFRSARESPGAVQPGPQLPEIRGKRKKEEGERGGGGEGRRGGKVEGEGEGGLGRRVHGCLTTLECT